MVSKGALRPEANGFAGVDFKSTGPDRRSRPLRASGAACGRDAGAADVVTLPSRTSPRAARSARRMTPHCESTGSGRPLAGGRSARGKPRAHASGERRDFDPGRSPRRIELVTLAPESPARWGDIERLRRPAWRRSRSPEPNPQQIADASAPRGTLSKISATAARICRGTEASGTARRRRAPAT